MRKKCLTSVQYSTIPVDRFIMVVGVYSVHQLHHMIGKRLWPGACRPCQISLGVIFTFFRWLGN